MEKTSLIVSYMVRCCVGGPEHELRICVRQVQSGEEHYFPSFEDAIQFMKEDLALQQEE